MDSQGRYIVAITGASGAVIGLRLIEFLLNYGADVAAIVSNAAWTTIRLEVLGLSTEPDIINPEYDDERFPIGNIPGLFKALSIEVDTARLKEYGQYDWQAPIASGSSFFDALIVAPCSMKTLSAIANGYSDTLLTRSVDVSLKEGRRTILVPRETPLSLIHLENMVKAKRAGADILPPVLEFYTRPAGIKDLVNFTVGKILNLLNIKHNLFTPWGE